MTAPFVRRLGLQRDGNAVNAELEDHIHHFRVRVEHDGERVTAVAGDGERVPWSLCTGAAAVLAELVGEPVGTLPRVEDPSLHCTHALDLARMAIRFAGDDAPERSVEVRVTEWDTPSPVIDVTGGDDSPEVALFIKRATWMAASRGLDLDDYDTLDQSGLRPGSCYSSQPERIHIARRNRDSSLKEM